MPLDTLGAIRSWRNTEHLTLPRGCRAGPSDSCVIEFRVPPDEGAYLMLNHAVGSTSHGAISLLVAERVHLHLHASPLYARPHNRARALR